MSAKGYVRLRRGGRKRMEHDLVWEAAHGPIPAGYQVHHRNENKSDNRLENLQLLSAVDHKRVHSGCELRDGVWWKPCRICKEFKPVTSEHWYFVATRGGHPMSVCRKCQVQLSVDGKRKRRRRALDSMEPEATSSPPAVVEPRR